MNTESPSSEESKEKEEINDTKWGIGGVVVESVNNIINSKYNPIVQFLTELDTKELSRWFPQNIKMEASIMGDLQAIKKEVEQFLSQKSLQLIQSEGIKISWEANHVLNVFIKIQKEIVSYWKRKELSQLQSIRELIKSVSDIDIDLVRELLIIDKKINEFIKEKETIFINELDSIINVMDNFFENLWKLWENKETSELQRNIQNLLSHDLKQSLVMKSIKESINYLWVSFIQTDFSLFEKNLLTERRFFLFFLESLLFVCEIPEKEIERKKTNFSLYKLIHYIKEVENLHNIEIESNIPQSISYYWIEWDLFHLIYNIVKNATKHGKATKIRFSIKNGALIIADNGIWIQWGDRKNLFKQGISWWGSSGLWLRNIEKRNVEISVSNEGLKNWNWKKRWARFEIKIQKRK